jgi:hypothetical protein
MSARKILCFAIAFLGIVASLSQAVRAAHPSGATAGQENTMDRFARRMNGHLHRLFADVQSVFDQGKPRGQDRGLSEQRQQDD